MGTGESFITMSVGNSVSHINLYPVPSPFFSFSYLLLLSSPTLPCFSFLPLFSASFLSTRQLYSYIKLQGTLVWTACGSVYCIATCCSFLLSSSFFMPLFSLFFFFVSFYDFLLSTLQLLQIVSCITLLRKAHSFGKPSRASFITSWRTQLPHPLYFRPKFKLQVCICII